MTIPRSLLSTLARILFTAALAAMILLQPASVQAARRAVPQQLAQEAASAEIWHTYTNGNYINTLALDGESLWAGTDGGLVRWDLAAGTYQKLLPADGLAGMRVYAALRDSSGDLWFGTNAGVSRYNGSTWTAYTTADGLVSNSVNAIAQDGAGNLWFATSGGVSKYSSGVWTSYTKSNSGLPSNSVTAVAAHAGVVWFGTYGSGIVRFDGMIWTQTKLGSGGSIENIINDLAVSGSGDLWIAHGNTMGGSGGGGGGLTVFDGTNAWTYTHENSGLACDYVFSVTFAPDGAVWAGTELGVSRFDGSSWTTYTTQNGLAGNWTQAILFDGVGSLYLGSDGGGITRSSQTGLTILRTDDPLPHNSLLGLEAVGADVWMSGADLFVITDFSAVTRFSGGEWDNYPYGVAGQDNPEAYAFAAEGPYVWIGGWKIDRFDGNTFTRFTDPYGTGIVRSIAVDGGEKWFSSYQPFGPEEWVSRLAGSTWTAFTTANSGLVDNTVYDIAVDVDHSEWFAADGGVSHFDGATWTTYTTTHGLANNRVNAIAISPSGVKWFATRGGVSRFDGLTWTTYSTADGLADNYVTSAAIDSYGTVWFGTRAGVSKFDGVGWTTYNRSNSGLLDDNVWKVTIDSADHKWIGSAYGLSELFTPPHLAINYPDGAPGSYFNLAGSGFPANRTATIWVNGQALGSLPTSPQGTFTFTLDTSQAGEGLYIVTASVNPSARVRFRLDPALPVRPKKGDLTPVSVPAGRAYTFQAFVPMMTK